MDLESIFFVNPLIIGCGIGFFFLLFSQRYLQGRAQADRHGRISLRAALRLIQLKNMTYAPLRGTLTFSMSPSHIWKGLHMYRMQN